MASLLDVLTHQHVVDPVALETQIEAAWGTLERALEHAGADVEAKLAEVARVELAAFGGAEVGVRLTFLTYLRRAARDPECLGLAPETESLCDRCDGSGWVHVDDDPTHRAVYPCIRCNQELHMRWSGGHLAADHDAVSCRDCQDRKRKADTAARGSRAGRAPTATETAEEADQRAVALDGELF